MPAVNTPWEGRKLGSQGGHACGLHALGIPPCTGPGIRKVTIPPLPTEVEAVVWWKMCGELTSSCLSNWLGIGVGDLSSWMVSSSMGSLSLGGYGHSEVTLSSWGRSCGGM